MGPPLSVLQVLMGLDPPWPVQNISFVTGMPASLLSSKHSDWLTFGSMACLRTSAWLLQSPGTVKPQPTKLKTKYKIRRKRQRFSSVTSYAWNCLSEIYNNVSVCVVGVMKVHSLLHISHHSSSTQVYKWPSQWASQIFGKLAFSNTLFFRRKIILLHKYRTRIEHLPVA